ncbi:MAG: Hydroxyacylglutathione hydrolase [Lentisphaerae bacterium ADurb.BinA184]|nr:MAG: Hydroxyacylglutathione hydrolase [Lentisphaerae bacterium ADurb.BinA184]
MQCIPITAETNAWLLVRGRRSLLIDCPCTDMAARLRDAGLPAPDAILHTQVQEEHCREWGDLAGVPVHVAADAVEVARRSDAFFADCRTQWPLDRRWDPEDRGMDRYGIGGAMTERPPARPLNVAGVLNPGQAFEWEGLRLEVIPLPGSGRRAIGLWCAEERILFSGDLLHAGGFLANFYDLERGYGIVRGHHELEASLRRAQGLSPERVQPATGPEILDFNADAGRLLDALGRLLAPTVYSPGRRPAHERIARPRFGLFQRHGDGLYQNWNYGAMIVLIDREGRGCCFDPDICVWHTWEENLRQMHEQLDLLERHAGLRRLEKAFITHLHGDHMEYAPLLRERYGTEILATGDVAEGLEHPRDYPYQCLLHWFNFPFDHFAVDRRLRYEDPEPWHDTVIRPFHAPGHCFAHAAFLFEWNGMRIACTGDTLQHDGGPVSYQLPLIYSDAGAGPRGYLPTYDRLLAEKPDLVLGAHSQWFDAADGAVVRDLRAAAVEWEERARALTPDGNLDRALTPPGFDPARARLLARASCR